MAIPDHCDDRARKFFYQGLVGKSHGEDGTSYRTSFSNDHEDLQPTKVYHSHRSRPSCVYCGKAAYSIQGNIPDCYEVTGHCCVCKDAMDEIEHRAKVEDLKWRHQVELEELAKQAPQPSPHVRKLICEAAATFATSNALTSDHGLQQLGVTIR